VERALSRSRRPARAQIRIYKNLVSKHNEFIYLMSVFLLRFQLLLKVLVASCREGLGRRETSDERRKPRTPTPRC